MFQPVGGMHELPKGFQRNLKAPIKLQHAVEKISQTPTSVTVHYTDAKGAKGTQVFLSAYPPW